jgi:hypothetical protein
MLIVLVLLGSGAHQQGGMRSLGKEVLHLEITTATHDWDIIQDWALAQQLIGIKGRSLFAPVIKQKIQSWHTSPCNGPCDDPVLAAQNLRYARIFQGGNEMIASNLRKMVPMNTELQPLTHAEAARSPKDACWFTFVREPTERFAAGYAEFEAILGQTSSIESELEDYGLTFHWMPTGSVERAQAFLTDIISLRWDIERSKPAGIWYKTAFSHILPMSTSTKNLTFDFVGRLDSKYLARDWECMKHICEQKTGTSLAKMDFDKDVAHAASGDWKKAESAMTQGLKNSLKLRCSLFLLLRHDYVDFAFEAPPECKKFKAKVHEASLNFHTRGGATEPETFEWFNEAAKTRCGKAVNPRLVQRPKSGSGIKVVVAPRKAQPQKSPKRRGSPPRLRRKKSAAAQSAEDLKRASIEAEQWINHARWQEKKEKLTQKG